MSARIAIVAFVLFVLGGVAHAYPQYQLSHDQTCTGCHIAPSGGGLLNENGLAMAETASMFGTKPEFLNGLFEAPSWLTLGGDLRASAGYIRTPEDTLDAFPMQIEAAASARVGAGVSVHATAGFGTGAFPLLSREHYVQWQQDKDSNEGLYVRAGRFMPVFGLRMAEHPLYTRRYGGVPLWGERYGLSASYVKQGWEAHATGFIEEPFVDPIVYGNGGAFYVEKRVCDCASIGLEGMYTKADRSGTLRLGATGKYWIESLNVLFQAEGQFVRQKIYGYSGDDAPLQIVGNLFATVQLAEFVQVDLGVGHYDSNLRIKDLDRDSVDLNVRYAMTSHVELQLNARYELMAFGNAGSEGAYVLGQLHYRL